MERRLPRAALSKLVRRAVSLAARGFGGNYGRLVVQDYEPDEATTIPIDGVSLSVLRWCGSGVPLVLLHGLNNNGWSWARVASALRSERPILSVTLRGHGRSSSPVSGYTLDHTTSDLIGLFDALGVERADLGGHSWGGKVACHFCASAPDRVRSLVLADPVPLQGLNPLIRGFPAIVRTVFRLERGPYPTRDAWTRGGKTLSYLTHWNELDQRLWADGFDRLQDGSYRHRLSEAGFVEILNEAIATDISARAASIHCPVLLMRPTFTVSFWPGEWRRMRATLPNLVERRISGDHTFIHTNPMDTSEAIRSFLDSLL